MSIFAGARKCDLKILAEELRETVDDSHKLKDLKNMILASKEYDKECAKEWLNTIINERKENDLREEEIQIAEQKHQKEIHIAERRRQEEIQMEERKRREEQEYEEGTERMKWNLSCKKYVLEHKVVFKLRRQSKCKQYTK
ncbi:hypothetical protein AVEN_34984-1 [Araneus ventricosus]|uniref:Uncharacterized protein n=1 Tax=Araneus ventricosus TaxID=182803 RepID=A0A4Y2DFD5_ARAVE|nr:hypothetical protein AVEN_34984-1 [Araneus ventricosus]